MKKIKKKNYLHQSTICLVVEVYLDPPWNLCRHKHSHLPQVVGISEELCWILHMLTCASSRHELVPSHEPRISGAGYFTFAHWYEKRGTHSKNKVTSIEPNPNFFKCLCLPLVSCRFIFTKMPPHQLKMVGVKHVIAYWNWDLEASCKACMPDTCTMVNKIVLRTRFLVIIAIFTLPPLGISAPG